MVDRYVAKLLVKQEPACRLATPEFVAWNRGNDLQDITPVHNFGKMQGDLASGRCFARKPPQRSCITETY